MVSPSYYGLCSDIQGIAEVCHDHNIPLLVDEAHGAHCYFSSLLPAGAMIAGADMCAQSIHKVMGSLTQSSMLHVKSNHIDIPMLESNLHVVQSTSPSYLLMTSLDMARNELATRGEELIGQAALLAEYARNEINNIKGICSMTKEVVGKCGVNDMDCTRLTFSARNIGLTGFELKTILFEDFNIDVELSDHTNVLAIISYANTSSDIDLLVSALQKISRTVAKGRIVLSEIHLPSVPPYVFSPRKAHYSKKKRILWKDAKNHVAGEMIAPYPPGIPIIYPGELITDEIWAFIEYYRKLNGHLHGPADSKLINYNIIDA